MPNQIQSSKFKIFLPFSNLTFIWHLNFGIWILFLTLSVGLLWKNWTSWHSISIGIVGLVLYYAITAIAWGRVIEQALLLNKNWGRIFGFLVGFYLSTFAIGIPVVVWKYDRLAVAGAMLVVGLAGFVLSFLLRHPERSEAESRDLIGYPRDSSTPACPEYARGGRNDGRTWHFILLGALAALFVFLLFWSRTGEYILSPWDSLPTFILIVFFGLTWLVGSLVFSSRPAKVVLLVIILFSFLIHLYVPLVYGTSFSGDKWRHLAIEGYLQTGQAYTPSIWGDKTRPLVRFGPMAVPEALVAGNKTSYAGQWSVTIMLAESLGASIFAVDWWLVFLLWSLFMPLLLYRMGSMFVSSRFGLFAAFLPTLFYTLQVDGAITLPVTFNYIFFFFVLWLWLDYSKRGARYTLGLASGLTLFFYWGYILHFFVLLIVGALAYIRRQGERIWFYLAMVAGLLFFQLLGTAQGLSLLQLDKFAPSALVGSVADGLGLISAGIGRLAILDVLEQGNFLYHQTAGSLSGLFLFSYPLAPFLGSTVVWVGAFWGAYRALRARRAPLVFFAWLFGIFISAYFLDFAFSAGLHIFVRRLDAFLAVGLVFFFGYAVWQFLSAAKLPITPRKRTLAVLFFISVVAASTFASGPKLSILPADDKAAAALVWSELSAGNRNNHYCVIAESWPLLVLEALSKRQVIGGGFPLLPEYQQPDLTAIFNGLMKEPRQEWLTIAGRVTQSDTCYYLNKKRLLSEPVFNQTVRLLGKPRQVGEMYIWKIESKRTVIAER